MRLLLKVGPEVAVAASVWLLFTALIAAPVSSVKHIPYLDGVKLVCPFTLLAVLLIGMCIGANAVMERREEWIRQLDDRDARRLAARQQAEADVDRILRDERVL